MQLLHRSESCCCVVLWVCNGVAVSIGNRELGRLSDRGHSIGLVSFEEVLRLGFDFVFVSRQPFATNELLLDAKLVDVDNTTLFQRVRLMLVEPPRVIVRVILGLRSLDRTRVELDLIHRDGRLGHLIVEISILRR